jgi:hypothetical protein
MAEGIEDRWTLFDHVPTIVDQKFDDGRQLTQSQLTAMNATINELRILAESITLETGAIPESITDAMFDREEERAYQIHLDALDKITDEWSKKGFTLPNTNLLVALSMEVIDYGNKRLDRNREILIKEWELTDANYKFSTKLKFDLKMEALKTIATINAQMVAGAFSSVSASVQMSASNAAQYQFSSNPSY